MIDFSCTMVWILIYSFYAYFIVLVCLWYAEFGDSLLLFIYQVFYSFSFFDFKRLFFKHWIKFKKNNFINYHKCAKVSDWVAPHNYRCCHNTLFSALVCVCVRICKKQNHGKIIVYPQQPTVNTTSRTSLSNIKD